MKLGCHCVLFKDKIATQTEALLRDIGATGFAGVELGARFFGLERREALADALAGAGLELAGLHIAVPMELWVGDPEKACSMALGAANFFDGLPGKNLVMSGRLVEDAVSVAKGIDAAAKACADKGVTLNYHNHAAEFENGAEFYCALRDHAPNLKFGFDLGWVQRGGFDPYEVLEENRGRVSYVHLRDFDGQLEGRDFPDIGQGATDFDKLMPFLNEYLPKDGWAVVEYETGEEDVGRYTAAKRFLAKYE